MRAKIIRIALPFCTLVVLVIISAIAPVGQSSDEWIPVIGSFFNAGAVGNLFVSVPLLLLSLVAIFLGLYFTLLKTNAVDFGQTSMILLLLMAGNPYCLHFSSTYIVVACLIWFQFCLLENQIFVSFLILSLASLIYAPAIWLVLVFMILLPIAGLPEPLRVLVKSLSGACVPHLYLLVFRWIMFDDAWIYVHHFVNQAIDVSSPFHLIGMPHYFLLVLLLYMLVRATLFFNSRSLKGILEYLLKMEFFMMISTFILVMLFYSSTKTTLFAIFSLPVSVILSYYFKNCEKTSRTSMEFLLLMCGLMICCISYIIN